MSMGLPGCGATRWQHKKLIILNDLLFTRTTPQYHSTKTLSWYFGRKDKSISQIPTPISQNVLIKTWKHVYPTISFSIPHIVVLQDKLQFFIIFVISNLSRETFFFVLLKSRSLLRHPMIPHILLLGKISRKVWFHVNYRGNQLLRDLLSEVKIAFIIARKEIM